MNERPILFNGEMVRAVLDGRKTQTRRLIKQRLPGAPRSFPAYAIEDGPHEGKWGFSWEDGDLPCPYGAPGDRLWVRETWGLDEPGILKKCNGKLSLYMDDDKLDRHFKLLYKATQSMDPDYPMHWRPSIHMPRWASRITLEVVSVRVERVQDINAKRGYGWESNPWVWAVEFKMVTP